MGKNARSNRKGPGAPDGAIRTDELRILGLFIWPGGMARAICARLEGIRDAGFSGCQRWTRQVEDADAVQMWRKRGLNILPFVMMASWCHSEPEFRAVVGLPDLGVGRSLEISTRLQ